MRLVHLALTLALLAALACGSRKVTVEGVTASVRDDAAADLFGGLVTSSLAVARQRLGDKANARGWHVEEGDSLALSALDADALAIEDTRTVYVPGWQDSADDAALNGYARFRFRLVRRDFCHELGHAAVVSVGGRVDGHGSGAVDADYVADCWTAMDGVTLTGASGGGE